MKAIRFLLLCALFAAPLLLLTNEAQLARAEDTGAQDDIITDDDVDVYEEDDDDDLDDDDEDDDLDSEDDDLDFDDSSPDLDMTSIFPDFPDRKFKIGENVRLLFSLGNNGDQALNISAIQAHLHSPFDYTYYIQNFTAKFVGNVVAPDTQMSFDYTFRPDKALDASDFWLSANVYYTNALNQTFRNTVFNGTVELVEQEMDLNVRKVLTYVVAVAGMTLIGYAMFVQNGGAQTKVGVAFDQDAYVNTKTVASSKAVKRKSSKGRKSKK